MSEVFKYKASPNVDHSLVVWCDQVIFTPKKLENGIWLWYLDTSDGQRIATFYSQFESDRVGRPLPTITINKPSEQEDQADPLVVSDVWEQDQ